MSNTAHNLDYNHLEALKTKSQLNTIITNKDATPDYLAINIYYDSLRSWYSPKKQYQEAGNVIHIKKLKSDGIYYSAEQLSKKHGCSKETIRKKLVKLELLGLIHRNFEHKSTPTTNSYNHRCIFVWKNTPHFYNPYGVDRKQIKKLKSQTNAEYVKSKYGVEFGVKTREDALLESGGGIHTLEDTKELREPFNKLKDRSTRKRESNISDISNNIISSSDTNYIADASLEKSAAVNIDISVKPQVAVVQKLRNCPPKNQRKKPTNAQKKARILKFNQYETPKSLKEMEEITDTECSYVQLKSGREFNLNAQNEMLKDMAKRLDRTFHSRVQFLSYFSECMVYEKRQACQINNENFKITVRMEVAEIVQHTTLAEREKYLNSVETESIMHVSPLNQLRAKLANNLPPSVAYNLLHSLICFSVVDEVLELHLTKEVLLTEWQEVIVIQEAHAVGCGYSEVESLAFVVKEAV